MKITLIGTSAALKKDGYAKHLDYAFAKLSNERKEDYRFRKLCLGASVSTAGCFYIAKNSVGLDDDIVILDFCINDRRIYYAAKTLRLRSVEKAVEGMIRALKNLNPQTEIFFLNLSTALDDDIERISKGSCDITNTYQRICEYYRVSFIDIAGDCLKDSLGSFQSLYDLDTDKYHPSLTFGAKKVGGQLYDSICKETRISRHPQDALPTALDRENFQTMQVMSLREIESYVLAEKRQEDTFSNSNFDEKYIQLKRTDSVCFKLKGTLLGIYYVADLDSGYLVIETNSIKKIVSLRSAIHEHMDYKKPLVRFLHLAELSIHFKSHEEISLRIISFSDLDVSTDQKNYCPTPYSSTPKQDFKGWKWLLINLAYTGDILKMHSENNFLSQGKVLLEEKEYKATIELFEEAIEEKKDNFWIHHILGCALEKEKLLDRAIASYRRAIEIDTDSKDAFWSHSKLAFILEKQGDLEAAAKSAEKAFSISPERLEISALLYRIYQSLGQLEKSQFYAKKSGAATHDSGSTQLASKDLLYFPIQKTRLESDAIAIKHKPLPSGVLDPKQLPIPPQSLMHYGESSEMHLKGGESAVSQMRAVLQESNVQLERCQRILEFGCSNGRLLRWLSPLAKDREIWGTDIESDKVFWAIENLTPLFNFLVNTTVPHLPFKSEHFDFIFAGSIFTHINELHISWLAELTRLLSPDGHMYLTFHDEHTLEYLRENPDKYRSLNKLLTDPEKDAADFYQKHDFYSKNNQVVMHSRYIKKLTQDILHIVEVTPRAYSGLQTAYLFARKY